MPNAELMLVRGWLSAHGAGVWIGRSLLNHIRVKARIALPFDDVLRGGCCSKMIDEQMRPWVAKIVNFKQAIEEPSAYTSQIELYGNENDIYGKLLPC